jgi:hypothetical protein
MYSMLTINDYHYLQSIEDQLYGSIVAYNCKYHLKQKVVALRLVRRPVGNASTSSFKRTLQHDDY